MSLEEVLLHMMAQVLIHIKCPIDSNLLLVDGYRRRGTRAFRPRCQMQNTVYHTLSYPSPGVRSAVSLVGNKTPPLLTSLNLFLTRAILNMHMSFTEGIRIDGQREIRFLYRLATGISSGSFGIECARLAGVPDPILSEATSRAAVMQAVMENKNKKAK